MEHILYNMLGIILSIICHSEKDEEKEKKPLSKSEIVITVDDTEPEFAGKLRAFSVASVTSLNSEQLKQMEEDELVSNYFGLSYI